MKKLNKKSYSIFAAVILGFGLILSGCQISADEHQHTFSVSWTSDATSHWHAATCEHTDQISGKASHTWDSGAISGDNIIFTCTVCKRQSTNVIHSRIYKDSVILTPENDAALNIVKKYKKYGTIKVDDYQINPGLLYEIHASTIEYVDLDYNMQVRAAGGYYVGKTQCDPFPNYIGDLTVLPNNQVYILAPENCYISLKSVETPTDLSDLIDVFETLPLDTNFYEVDPNTNEYVLKGYSSKQLVQSGYFNWMNVPSEKLSWVEKEISFDDLYKLLSGKSEVPETSSGEEKINQIKSLSGNALDNVNIYVGWLNVLGEPKFYLKSFDGYCLGSDNTGKKLDKSINRISNELGNFIIVPASGYIINGNTINLNNGAASVIADPKIDFAKVIAEKYNNKASLYTNRETGEICYLVY